MQLADSQLNNYRRTGFLVIPSLNQTVMSQILKEVNDLAFKDPSKDY